MSRYTEHVTRILDEDIEHPRIGTVALLRFAPPAGERRPATLGPASVEAAASALDTALGRAASGEIQAIVLTGTDRVFLAGADLSLFADPEGAAAAGPMTDTMHALQERVRRSGVPILAHLNGATLGGGLEVALMADIRTATPDVRGIGVPETSLGILPGWGGTTLLPGILGGETSVRLILEDPAREKQLDARASQEIGLVDAVASDLDAALDHLADALDSGLDVSARPAPVPTAGSAAAEALRDALDAPHSPAETRRQWAARREAEGAPALARTIALLEELPERDLTEALAAEKAVLLDLVRSPASAASLYSADLLRRGKPGRTPVEGAREIRRVGVAGAGLMASQIAAQLALGLRVPVLLRDLDREIAETGLAHAREVIGAAAAKGKLPAADAEEVSALLAATSQVEDLADCDLVLEAVPEVLGVKQRVFAELEGVLDPSALLVTNTSSLSLTAMSEGLEHPERVLGLHFFNPVAKMPLVEVLRTEDTDASALATGREVVRQCRKFAVDSADAPGFIVNRLLFRVLGEVLRSLDAGADPEAVNASLDPLGLPMRPLALLDLVGPGVAAHVGSVLVRELGAERFWDSPGLAEMVRRGAAFTEASRERVHPRVAPVVREIFAGDGSETGGASAAGTGSGRVGEDLLHAVQDGLAQEIALLLETGVTAGAEQIDLALILGAGFPRHRGGITPYLDEVGASQRITGGTFHGPRFA